MFLKHVCVLSNPQSSFEISIKIHFSSCSFHDRIRQTSIQAFKEIRGITNISKSLVFVFLKMLQMHLFPLALLQPSLLHFFLFFFYRALFLLSKGMVSCLLCFTLSIYFWLLHNALMNNDLLMTMSKNFCVIHIHMNSVRPTLKTE